MNRETYIRKVKKQLDWKKRKPDHKTARKTAGVCTGAWLWQTDHAAVRKTKSCCSVFGGGWTVLSVCTGRKSAVSDAEKCHWRWGCDDDDRAAKLVTGKQQRDFWGIGGHLYGCTGFPFTKEEK